MKRAVHYRQGYKIVITNKFYEVSKGNRITHFGELRHKPTLQEVWNKTIGLEQGESSVQRFKAYNKRVYTADCCR